MTDFSFLKFVKGPHLSHVSNNCVKCTIARVTSIIFYLFVFYYRYCASVFFIILDLLYVVNFNELTSMSLTRSFGYLLKSRAVPIRLSLLFGQKQITKTIIRLHTNRIRIVTLNFEAMSLSFVIVKINIVILDMHSHSMLQFYQYECKMHMYSQSR